MTSEEFATHVDQVVAAVENLEGRKERHLIAIAGPPASGKSTLAENVQQRLEQNGTPCGLVPMDGFHLDNDILRQRGLLARKGAPETFDVEGFGALVALLRHEDDVSIPLFNRVGDCVDQDAGSIVAAQRHVLVEGNYLFLNRPGWRALNAFWSFKVFLAPPSKELERRLIERWIDHGLDQNAAEKRATENDLVNANLVLEHTDCSTMDLIF
ncbi:MAG: AAA family ATPase [Pseudomonadota bacterium]